MSWTNRGAAPAGWQVYEALLADASTQPPAVGVKPGDPWWFVTGEQQPIWDYLTKELKLDTPKPIPPEKRLNPLDFYEHDLRIVLLDPQGRAIHHAIEGLGIHGVQDVRAGKVIARSAPRASALSLPGRPSNISLDFAPGSIA